MLYAVIGGTGLQALAGDRAERRFVRTRYGDVHLSVADVAGQEVAFLHRHGTEAKTPPHKVNYRANICALRSLGVKRILAAASVGSLNERLQPGDFVILTQFLDFTKSRASTFFDEPDQPLVHISMDEPYCPDLRGELAQAGKSLGERLHVAGTYVCAEGPRFETPAEITMFRQLGGDVVGMTGVPEVVLAREANLCYALVAIVANWAAGLSREPLSQDAVTQAMVGYEPLVRSLLVAAIERGSARTEECRCQRTVSAELA